MNPTVNTPTRNTHKQHVVFSYLQSSWLSTTYYPNVDGMHKTLLKKVIYCELIRVDRIASIYILEEWPLKNHHLENKVINQ